MEHLKQIRKKKDEEDNPCHESKKYQTDPLEIKKLSDQTQSDDFQPGQSKDLDSKSEEKIHDETESTRTTSTIKAQPQTKGIQSTHKSLKETDQEKSSTAQSFKNKNILKEESIDVGPSSSIKIGKNFSSALIVGIDEEECAYLTNNPLICTNKLRQWKTPFLKSQSLELYNESSFYSNVFQRCLTFQLPEISEAQVPDAVSETQESDNRCSTSSSSNMQSTATTLAGGLPRPNMPARFQTIDSRPIYPNVPYSPYASPHNSPRIIRKRTPLRESRRVSIEITGSFQQLNQYKVTDSIGQGAYGLVKLAYSEEDSTHYAMKILSKRKLIRNAGFLRKGPKKTKTPLDRVYHEIAVLKKLDHPNVVKLVEVLDDPDEDSLYLVFELVKQGEVLSVPTDKPLNEERAWNMFRETLLGLEYLHYQKIIHGDLKPGNLLLTECGHIKIADLGVCNEFLGDDATMSNSLSTGTPAFRAPETLTQGQLQYCGKAADIWALGATLFALVYGNVPFHAQSIPVLYERIKNEDVVYPDVPKLSENLKNCIREMLTKDPALRITLPQLKEHPWVTADGKSPLPSEDENCRLVQVSEEEISSGVRSIPKLDTLILIKTMLKKHSFGNPFARASVSGRPTQRDSKRLERFARAGRSISAPESYDIVSERPQLSSEQILPSLDENSPTTNTDREEF